MSDDVDVLVELIGGDTTAREIVAGALDAGRHVVTANKALLAAFGGELFDKAEQGNRALGFEAAVAGGIPIINALRNGLAANEIDVLAGIVNGTSNYILTAMEDDGWAFADALAEAQRLGYAEADPTFDVEGIDAAQKLAILAALAFDTGIDFEGVHVEGISQVDIEDIRYARELGFSIKHLGIARLTDAGVEARVHPALVPETLLLAKVAGVMNAVMVHGSAVGPTLYVGPGAGGMPTASAVVADLVEVARGSLAVPRAPKRRLTSLPIDRRGLSPLPEDPSDRPARRLRRGRRHPEPPRHLHRGRDPASPGDSGGCRTMGTHRDPDQRCRRDRGGGVRRRTRPAPGCDRRHHADSRGGPWRDDAGRVNRRDLFARLGAQPEWT